MNIIFTEAIIQTHVSMILERCERGRVDHAGSLRGLCQAYVIR